MQIDYVIVDCTATAPSENLTLAEWRRVMMLQGAPNEGIHYLIHRDGTIEQGLNHTEVGQHTDGYNLNSLCVMLVGGRKANSRKAQANYTPAQYLSLQTLLEDLSDQYPWAEITGQCDLPGQLYASPSFDVGEWLRRIHEEEHDALHSQDDDASGVRSGRLPDQG